MQHESVLCNKKFGEILSEMNENLICSELFATVIFRTLKSLLNQ